MFSSTLYPCYFDKLLNDLDRISKKGINNFGYVERMILERTLFAILQIFVRSRLSFEVHGFSDFHKIKILNLLNDSSTLEYVAIKRIFDLRNYLQSLSSENPYVRGDTILKLNVGSDKIFLIIQTQVEGVQKIIAKIEDDK